MVRLAAQHAGWAGGPWLLPGLPSWDVCWWLWNLTPPSDTRPSCPLLPTRSNDDDSGVINVSAASNSLNLLMRDEGLMKFVKYVSFLAPSSRWVGVGMGVGGSMGGSGQLLGSLLSAVDAGQVGCAYDVHWGQVAWDWFLWQRRRVSHARRPGCAACRYDLAMEYRPEDDSSSDEEEEQAGGGEQGRGEQGEGEAR
jgi:hypothetical protein